MIDRLNAAKGTRRISDRRDLPVGHRPNRARRCTPTPTRSSTQLQQGASFQAYARQFSRSLDRRGRRRPRLGPARAAARRVGTRRPADAGRRARRADRSPGRLLDHRGAATQRQILIADPRDAVLSLMQVSIRLPAGHHARAGQSRAAAASPKPRKSMGGCGGAEKLRRRAQRRSGRNGPGRARAICRRRCSRCCCRCRSARQRRRSARSRTASACSSCAAATMPRPRLPTFDQVYSQLKEERVNTRAQRYLRDLRRDAVIDYR